MSTTTKVECICGDSYPVDECHELVNGQYIYYGDSLVLEGEYVPVEGTDDLWTHRDECIICEDDDCYYLEEDVDGSDIAWDEYSECYRFTDNMVWGYVDTSSEGWFSNECDYVYSEAGDVYFINADVASRCDYIYSENQDDWVHEDDYQDDDENGEEWNNQFRVPVPPRTTTYKDTFGMEYTFGVEIETCEGEMCRQDDLSLSCVADGSINGMEYVTGILKGDKGLEMLKSICNRLHLNDCYVDKACGLHVHIGGANFNRKFSILSLMLGQILQDEIFTMMPKSRSEGSYCFKIRDKYRNIRYVNKKLYPRIHDRTLKLLAEYVYQDSAEFNNTNNKNTTHPYGRYHSSRYTWLNLNNCSYKFSPDTIEFRCHSGTTDYKKIYNWILICMCFVRYIENNPRKIIESWKVYQAWRPHDNTLCLRDIVVEGIKNPDEAMKLLKYIDTRKDKFVEN